MAVRPSLPSVSNVPNLDYIRQKDPKLHETIAAIVAALPKAAIPSPNPVTAINVTAQDGIFHATLSDSGQIQKGVGYFLEYDTDPTFTRPTVIDLGASRQYRGYLGNQNLYWRGYSQLSPPLNSMPSAPLVHGGSVPLVVNGGGSAMGPTILPSTGSGTAATNGQQGGQGHGINLVRQQ